MCVKRLGMLLLPLMLLLYACRSGEEGATLTTEQSEQLTRLTDSISVLSPSAKPLADSLLATATDSLFYYSVYAERGVYFINAAQFDSVFECSRRTILFAQRQQPSPRVNGLLSQAYAIEAIVYHRTRRNTVRSIELYGKSLDLVLQSDNKKNAPTAAANLADAYIMLNDIPTAARLYRRALFLSDSLGLPPETNTTLYLGLAQIYTTLEDYQSALYYYEQTDKQFGKIEANMQFYFLNNFGNYYYYKGDYTQALRMFKRMEAAIQKHKANDLLNMSFCKINMADTYLNLGVLDSATVCVDEADRMFKQFNINDGMYYATTIRIGIALKRKDYAAVRRLLADADQVTSTDLNMRNIRSRYLTAYYAATGDYQKAFATQTANRQQMDSTEHKKQNMRASEIMSRFSEDTLRLHFALEMGEKNAEVAESRATLYLTLFVLAVLVGGSVIVWNVQRRRKAQADLDMFMLRLTTIRQRISPHFVFNVINAKLGNAPKEEADLLLSMAKLIRKNLELTGRTFVPLSEELAFVDRYVSLQSSLISGGIDYQSILPEEPGVLERITIPSMFVQILVENAIKHGLRSIDGDKRLTITVAVDDCQTTISVADNGPGFDIRRRAKDSTRTGLSIIRNTMAVVNKNNKRNAQMHFDIGNRFDRQGGIAGCTATLVIPHDMKTL